MIVVTIMGLLAAAVAVGVTHQFRIAQIRTTTIDAKAIRGLAAVWRTDHRSDECPTARQLRDDKLLDPSSKITDAWGSPFQIVCEADETSVLSLGPDRTANTADDLREPDPDEGKVAVR